jgi:hypothetical protein
MAPDTSVRFHPSRLAVKNGEHLRMTAALVEAMRQFSAAGTLRLIGLPEDQWSRGVNPAIDPMRKS